MVIIGFIKSELRRICIILIAVLPTIVFSIIVSYNIDSIILSDIPIILEGLVLILILWTLPILFPVYIVIFTLLPAYHKVGESYYYLKLFRLKEIASENIIEIIEVDGMFGSIGVRYFGPGYNYYFKGESIPVRIVVIKKTTRNFNYPSFAEEIIAKFPPKEFLPIKIKDNFGDY